MQRQLKQYYKISKLFSSDPSVVLGIVLTEEVNFT